MTPEREKLIRTVWRNYGHLADFTGDRRIFRCYVPLRIERVPIAAFAPVREQAREILTFELERGSVDGELAERITCEGVVLRLATIEPPGTPW